MAHQTGTQYLAVVESLKRQGITFGVTGPTPKGRRIYVIENYPFTETELVHLLEAGKLNPDGIGKLRRQIEKK